MNLEMQEFQLYAKDLNSYSAADVRNLEFMTDEELDQYQLELERDSGNLSDCDHRRAALTFRKKAAAIERLKGDLQAKIKELDKRIAVRSGADYRDETKKIDMLHGESLVLENVLEILSKY